MMFDLFKKSEPVKIRFFFDPETNKKQFTVFDDITLERYQNGNVQRERLYIMMSHFMVDKDNKFLGEERGMKALERCSAEELTEIVPKFFEGFQQSAVPKANGSVSKLTPVPGSVETLPDGSQL